MMEATSNGTARKSGTAITSLTTFPTAASAHNLWLSITANLPPRQKLPTLFFMIPFLPLSQGAFWYMIKDEIYHLSGSSENPLIDLVPILWIFRVKGQVIGRSGGTVNGTEEAYQLFKRCLESTIQNRAVDIEEQIGALSLADREGRQVEASQDVEAEVELWFL